MIHLVQAAAEASAEHAYTLDVYEALRLAELHRLKQQRAAFQWPCCGKVGAHADGCHPQLDTTPEKCPRCPFESLNWGYVASHHAVGNVA